jgi:hypothetical protein
MRQVLACVRGRLAHLQRSVLLVAEQPIARIHLQVSGRYELPTYPLHFLSFSERASLCIVLPNLTS